LIQDIMKARTASEFQVVIEDAAPVDLDANPQLVRSAEPPPSLAQLIIRPGESGGLLTGTEFRFANFCTEEKLKKRTSDRLLGMLKERAIFLEDLRADSIREIEKLISDSCKDKITEYDLWTEMDGLQEVKLYLNIEIFSTCTLSTGNVTVSAYSDQPMEAYGGKSQFVRSDKAIGAGE
jgi:hypothetical protein